MTNRLEQRFNPAEFQIMVEGRPVKLPDLSHDDLLQVACEAQLVLNHLEDSLERVHSSAKDVFSAYHVGKTPVNLGEDDPA